MSRQLEAVREDRRIAWDKETVAACNGGLEDSIGRAGGVLSGFSFKASEVDCLITLRVDLAGRRQISFVGGPDLGSCLRKAMRLASRDGLVFRDDKWVGNGG